MWMGILTTNALTDVVGSTSRQCGGGGSSLCGCWRGSGGWGNATVCARPVVDTIVEVSAVRACVTKILAVTVLPNCAMAIVLHVCEEKHVWVKKGTEGKEAQNGGGGGLNRRIWVERDDCNKRWEGKSEITRSITGQISGR